MRLVLAGLCLCCAASSAHAQIVISGGDFQRYLRPGYNIPSDGEPFSHRYGYSTDQSSFYFGHAGWRLGYLEYLDRQDRADKFGYHVSFDPRYEFPDAPIQGVIIREEAAPTDTVVEPAPVSRGRVGLGLGLGLFRRR
jgi:hypothetical protein